MCWPAKAMHAHHASDPVVVLSACSLWIPLTMYEGEI